MSIPGLNSAKPKISFHVNSFNRLFFLRNLLKSFEACNQYSNAEWIITDYGSKDGSREFIEKYAGESQFPVKYIFGDEGEYFEKIRQRGLKIDNRWARFRAILSKFRNEARDIAESDFLFDVSDDHQFIRRGNWTNDILDIFSHHERTTGKDDISGIVPYGYYEWRFSKKNNRLETVRGNENAPYFVACEKNYVDYSVMKTSTYRKIGKFIGPLDFRPESDEWRMWQEENDDIQPESEYERRCTAHGLKRVFMKYPILVSIPNDAQKKIKKATEGGLLFPTWTLEEMKQKFGHLGRPVSSDELCGISVDSLKSRILRKIKGLSQSTNYPHLNPPPF